MIVLFQKNASKSRKAWNIKAEPHKEKFAHTRSTTQRLWWRQNVPCVFQNEWCSSKNQVCGETKFQDFACFHPEIIVKTVCVWKREEPKGSLAQKNLTSVPFCCASCWRTEQENTLCRHFCEKILCSFLCSQIRLALEVKKVAYSIRVVSLEKLEHFEPDYLRINQHGRVPTLVHGQTLLHDSDDIIRYLDKHSSETQISPRARPVIVVCTG